MTPDRKTPWDRCKAGTRTRSLPSVRTACCARRFHRRHIEQRIEPPGNILNSLGSRSSIAHHSPSNGWISLRPAGPTNRTISYTTGYWYRRERGCFSPLRLLWFQFLPRSYCGDQTRERRVQRLCFSGHVCGQGLRVLMNYATPTARCEHFVQLGGGFVKSGMVADVTGRWRQDSGVAAIPQLASSFPLATVARFGRLRYLDKAANRGG
jgi:hypothetical protein